MKGARLRGLPTSRFSGYQLVLTLCVTVLMGSALVPLAPTPHFAASTEALVSRKSTRPTESKAINTQDHLDGPHTLAASYYKVGGNSSSTLMLSNQGPHQFEIRPALFSLSGERFDAPPQVMEPTTAYAFDIGEWAAMAGTSFQQGSVQVSYIAMAMELAGVVQIVNASQSLSFDEELTEPAARFLSSRLEGVWWLPSRRTEMTLVLTNTSSTFLTASLSLTGNEPARNHTTLFSLNPHEARVLDVRELTGEQGEAIPKLGGISINHEGIPGALIARGLIREDTTGFSSVVEFSDPKQARSARIDGAGLRIGRIGNEDLSQIIVARNTDGVSATLNGRIPYSKSNGATGVILLPQVEFTPGETKVIEAATAIRRSGVKGIATAGLEFEYSGAPGSMIMSAYSISRNRNHTFRVLLTDAASLPSSAGTYPWNITDDSSTMVYIKNVTSEPQDFIMVIRYGTVTDGYSPSIQKIAPGQTKAIDLRKLRNDQVPDGYGRTLPLDATGGQVHWSARGRTRLSMIGRSEQVSISKGISMTAACGEPCCGDMFVGGFLSPDRVTGFIGEVTSFIANEQIQDCFGTPFTYPTGATFTSSNPSVASCDANGTTIAVGLGSAIITGTWHYFSNRPSGDFQTPQCFTEEGDTSADASCDVLNGSVIFTKVVQDFGVADFSPGITGDTFSATLSLPSNSPPCTGSAFLMIVRLRKRSDATLHDPSDPRNFVDTPADSQYRVNGGGLQSGTSNDRQFDIRLQRITPGNPNRRIRIGVAGFTSSGAFSAAAFVTITCP